MDGVFPYARVDQELAPNIDANPAREMTSKTLLLKKTRVPSQTRSHSIPVSQVGFLNRPAAMPDLGWRIRHNLISDLNHNPQLRRKTNESATFTIVIWVKEFIVTQIWYSRSQENYLIPPVRVDPIAELHVH